MLASSDDNITGRYMKNAPFGNLSNTSVQSSQGGQLTMGIIGCLPDNVQQAIKSFSVRESKQHVTLAFPFMENMLERFSDTQTLLSPGANSGRFKWITPALLLDTCPEVIQGFETIMTLVPSTHRSSHLIGLLTVNQKCTTEGLRSHLEALITCLVSKKTVHNLWHLPIIASDLSGSMLEDTLECCSRAVLKIHEDNLHELYPGKTVHEYLAIIKKKIIRPSFLSYHDLLSLNIQEVLSKLECSSSSVNPAYFRSVMELLQAPSCSLVDFRKVHVYFMGSQVDPAIKEFWKLWSHEQIACKVFPVTVAASKLGSMCYTTSSHGETYMVSQSQCSMSTLLGNLTHVPLKEGLANVIKCLKNQDFVNSPPLSPEEKSEKGKCNCKCGLCRGDVGSGRMKRSEKIQHLGSVSSESAFHRPVTCTSSNRNVMPTSQHALYTTPSLVTYRAAAHSMRHSNQLRSLAESHQSTLLAPVPQHAAASTMVNYSGFLTSDNTPRYPWRLFSDQ